MTRLFIPLEQGRGQLHGQGGELPLWIFQTGASFFEFFASHELHDPRGLLVELFVQCLHGIEKDKVWVLSSELSGSCAPTIAAAIAEGEVRPIERYVETRAQYVTQMRSILRSEGIKAASCDTQNFVSKLEETDIPKELRKQIAPLVLILTTREPQLKRAVELLDNHCEDQPVVILLSSAPGVGRIVSAAFISVVDDPKRFRKAHQLEAYLGLVPSESTSGRRKVGSITKQEAN